MTKLVIGAFKPSRSGGWEGTVRTLVVNAKVRLVPNDDRAGPNAPTFRVMMGSSRIGDAWEARWGSDGGRSYFRVSLDDPFLRMPLSAALFPDEEGANAQLVWTRPSKDEGKDQKPGKSLGGKRAVEG
ncbi:DUF736 domain-containing protein [Caulobacter vibrioides]|uniref:DUF736 domain-containing protein n=2 Tax=Caulobacter vibrioides TaxID=155892 RepID=Q9A4Y9_CAUVC|nr:DUF736 domain-containing protein [Caulobacter vibrioides]YP_002518138.1 DUF736 domain-containing protein [Caulobacter vibrioides NA1000]AAK24649.1 conserved hypothetical protein [Caulobacter vibrioides CB15]ACL96230.1 DUF736 domain-containing protein [Caulobacter vibrioides NA1000]ATC29520.1 DUF736 domain-containing protein [Caulobacter vibrioides]AZH13751.1 DUF736 domain-containing protein [Caulobacter vibrioides]QXZ51043.1 DUF736 domain-containing protein [Caulobacter vibrioides]